MPARRVCFEHPLQEPEVGHRPIALQLQRMQRLVEKLLELLVRLLAQLLLRLLVQLVVGLPEQEDLVEDLHDGASCPPREAGQSMHVQYDVQYEHFLQEEMHQRDCIRKPTSKYWLQKNKQEHGCGKS